MSHLLLGNLLGWLEGCSGLCWICLGCSVCRRLTRLPFLPLQRCEPRFKEAHSCLKLNRLQTLQGWQTRNSAVWLSQPYFSGVAYRLLGDLGGCMRNLSQTQQTILF